MATSLQLAGGVKRAGRVLRAPAGDTLPACNAVWLPGGYPEPHAAALSACAPLREALAAHAAADRPDVLTLRPQLSVLGPQMLHLAEAIAAHGAPGTPGALVLMLMLMLVGTRFNQRSRADPR